MKACWHVGMLACRQVGIFIPGSPVTFGESLVFLVALMSGILDSIARTGACGGFVTTVAHVAALSLLCGGFFEKVTT